MTKKSANMFIEYSTVFLTRSIQNTQMFLHVFFFHFHSLGEKNTIISKWQSIEWTYQLTHNVNTLKKKTNCAIVLLIHFYAITVLNYCNSFYSYYFSIWIGGPLTSQSMTVHMACNKFEKKEKSNPKL